MPPGGARARSGPAPDPNALRRDRKDDAATWVTLPIEGRKGRAPKCPLLEPTKREADLWRELWKLPQAVMWERLHLEREVALYVRRYGEAELAEAEGKTTSSTATGVVIRLATMLGLNTDGLAKLRWRIPATAPVEEPAAGAPSSGGSVRDRLTVVHGGSA